MVSVRRSVPLALLLAGMIVVCTGVATSAQTPAASPTPAPATSTSGGLQITRESDGQTVHVPQGERVTVRLGADLDWTLSFDPPDLLQPVPGAGTLAQGVQALLRAAQPGTTTLTAEGKPRCNPGQTCAQVIVSVIVTVIVDPVSSTGQQPSPPATPAVAASPPTAAATPGVGLPGTGTSGLSGPSAAAATAAGVVALLVSAALLALAVWRWRRDERTG